MGYADDAREANKLYLANLDRQIAAHHKYNRVKALRWGAFLVLSALLIADLIWLYDTKRGRYEQSNIHRQAGNRRNTDFNGSGRSYYRDRVDSRTRRDYYSGDRPYWAQGR